ncbi:hypothetical protein V1525DRAFT_400017 [Lipomyces kononenkoae]|uniref:Uncharacterized protein n=1 Tax=Lipomyces kononenkoae TaxID=34357 RepID=A0ACC3T570_LIPKO
MVLLRLIRHTATTCCSVLDENENEHIDIPKGPAFALGITALVFTIVMFLLNYVATVILTLAAVEDPHESYSRLGSESSQPLVWEDDNDVDADGAQLEAADGVGRSSSGKGRFFTSTIRRTITYLRNEAGPWGPFRGLSVYIVMQIFSWLYVHFVASLFPILLQPVVYLGLVVCLAPFSLVLTHVILTVPAQRNWFRRLRNTPFRLSKLTVPVLAAEYLAWQVTSIPSFIILEFGLPYMGHGGWKALFGTFATLFGISLFFLLFILLSVPATVVRIRVQASFLPDDEEQIISFDREAFGTITTMRDAMYSLGKNLKTFSLSDRMRLFRLIVKFMVIGIALSILFICVLTGELVWMVKENPDIGKYLQETFFGQS